MVRIIGLCGSLRRSSYNLGLLKAAAQAAPPGATIDIADIQDIPLYNLDIEERGIPPQVEALKQRLRSADGLLIATPEYNSSIPGVLKNTVDWLSRPADDIEEVFGDLPVALMGTTPGSVGTVQSQTAWLPVLKHLRTRVWSGGRLGLSKAAEVFEADGALEDDEVRETVREFVLGFAEFAAASPRARNKLPA